MLIYIANDEKKNRFLFRIFLKSRYDGGFLYSTIRFSKQPLAVIKLHLYNYYYVSPGEGEWSPILAIRVCAAGKGMVFKPFGLV